MLKCLCVSVGQQSCHLPQTVASHRRQWVADLLQGLGVANLNSCGSRHFWLLSNGLSAHCRPNDTLRLF